MIVLDTNVISAAISDGTANEAVKQWLNAQRPAELFITSLSIQENLFGVEMMPDGKKKTRLLAAYNDVFALFNGRVLDFDTAAARVFSVAVSKAKKAGFNPTIVDSMIASIAVSRNMFVATRDIGPFNILMPGKVINPWDES